MTLYEILGVLPGASDKAIKSAWRSKSQIYHPDKSNGDAEKFRQVQEAYAVLSDADKRAQYDATGEVPKEAPAVAGEALELLRQAMELYVDQCGDPSRTDMVGALRKIIGKDRAHALAEADKLRTRQGRARTAAARTTAADGKEAMLPSLLEHLVQSLAGPLQAAERHVERCDYAIKVLDDHRYRVDQQLYVGTRSAFRFGSL